MNTVYIVLMCAICLYFMWLIARNEMPRKPEETAAVRLKRRKKAKKVERKQGPSAPAQYIWKDGIPYRRIE